MVFGFSKKAFAFFFVLFLVGLVRSCETAFDCNENQICVGGVCSTCDKENVGKWCSDYNINNYKNDGVCTFDNKCEETTVCLNSAFGKIFSSCSLCQDGDKCITNFQGSLNYDGLCFENYCITEYCVANSLGAVDYCGALSQACSVLNEEKPCDFVGDGEFKPENKVCTSQKCIEKATTEKVEQKTEKVILAKEEKKQSLLAEDSIIDVAFGRLTKQPFVFYSLLLLSFLAVSLFFQRSNEALLTKAKTTNQKRLVMFITALVSSMLFFSIFQIGGIFGEGLSYAVSIIFIIALLGSYFFKIRLAKEKKVTKL